MTNARKGLCGNEIWKCIIIYMDYSQKIFNFILLKPATGFWFFKKKIERF